MRLPSPSAVGRRAQRVLLVARADRVDRLVEVERAHGAHVDGARQALAHERGVRRLVDDHAGHQFGGVLVEFDAAVVAGADHLAAVEQRGGEVGRQAADADHLRAAADALRGQAGQAGDRFGDGDVGQLADVFGRDGFDDRGRFLLDRRLACSMPTRMPCTVTDWSCLACCLARSSCCCSGVRVSCGLAGSFVVLVVDCAQAPVASIIVADASATLSRLRFRCCIWSPPKGCIPRDGW